MTAACSAPLDWPAAVALVAGIVCVTVIVVAGDAGDGAVSMRRALLAVRAACVGLAMGHVLVTAGIGWFAILALAWFAHIGLEYCDETGKR